MYVSRPVTIRESIKTAKIFYFEQIVFSIGSHLNIVMLLKLMVVCREKIAQQPADA